MATSRNHREAQTATSAGKFGLVFDGKLKKQGSKIHFPLKTEAKLLHKWNYMMDKFNMHCPRHS